MEGGCVHGRGLGLHFVLVGVLYVDNVRTMTVKVNPDGLLVVPREACESLGLKAGEAVELQADGGLLLVWKKSESDPFSKWLGRGRLPFGRSGDEYLGVMRDGDGC